MCSGVILNLLNSQNRPILVRVLTHVGPQYWAKERTVGCIRYSRKWYYTPRFADLFLSLLLTNEARIKKCLYSLYLHFSNTSLTSGLLPSSRHFCNSITSDITSHKVFLIKIKDLKYKAAMAGEFQVISHDETFKAMFCLIIEQIETIMKKKICKNYAFWIRNMKNNSRGRLHKPSSILFTIISLRTFQ